ncbi:MAG: type I restriction enzyme HsdR N-terminal domain-containing protein, partial [Euryarchaeota archaeon]|nr:type I restriction enzyme HsdR N-terminal domain-containing protein [Euryarchaeota archaeon]MCG2728126.1 type I restriction enzyme HsdR N-terminal domain-containing protein [Candidatus Methanoperedenaceae archaeon]
MSEFEFLDRLLAALSRIREEITEGGGEFDFRYSLSRHLIEGVLIWSRKKGEGHFEIEKERKDIVLYDDGNPPFPAIILETKKPSETLEMKHYDQLNGYLESIGCARYGILTNGRVLILYEYDPERKTQKKFELNIDEVLGKSVVELEPETKKKLLALQLLARERFVKRGDAEYFGKHYKETPLKYVRGLEDIGYSLFITSLKTSLEELTGVLSKFFDSFFERKDYSGEFLRKSFTEWEGWREFSGGKGEAKEIFCRETAYILLRLEKDKRALLSERDLKSHEKLEEELNFCLGSILKRLNRFDFKEVNRDILGH